MQKIFTCLSLLALFALSVAAQGQTSIDYIDENGEPQSKSPYTPVTANDTEWKDGTYVATGNISLSSRVTVTGSVTLILADDCNLNATQGINVGPGNSLTIYGQAEDTGNLTAEASGYMNKNAAIGGNENTPDFGKIILAATGTITAKRNDYAAAIGGGGNGGTVTGSIHICQGTVVVNGYTSSVGMGAGPGGTNNSTITITGGDVTVSTGNFAKAAIGGSSGDGTLTISGGKVSVSAGVQANCFSGCTFSTGDNGNAIIFTEQFNFDTSGLSGVIFVKNDQSGYDG